MRGAFGKSLFIFIESYFFFLDSHVFNIISGGSFICYCIYRAKSAIPLMEQFTDKTRFSLLKGLCTQNIYFWKEPIQATSASLFTIHRESLLGGQMESALSCAMHSCRHMFMSGNSLTELNDQCISVTAKMVCLGIDKS